MQIDSFNPTQGAVGTTVTLQLSDAPPDAATDNTSVLISGDPQFDVTSVDIAADGTGTITGTLAFNAQSGDFVVLVMSPSQGEVGAMSGEVFTVTAQQDQPQFTNVIPRNVTPGQQGVMLMGSSLDQIQSLRVGTVQVTQFVRTGTTQIRFTVPLTVQPGLQRIYGQTQQWGRVNCPIPLTVAAAEQVAV